MSYSQFYFKEKYKVPVFLLIIFILVVFLTGWFFLRTAAPKTKAAKNSLRQIEIVNLSETQAGIYWQTDTKITSWIAYGENQRMNNVIFDERDVEENKKPYLYHYVLLRGLKKDTEYFFKIVSNNQVLGMANNEPFSFKTPVTTISTSLSPAYGKAILENNQPLQNAVVILKLKQAYSLLALTKASGEWLIPLSFIFEKDTHNPKTLTKNEPLTIEILNEEGAKTTITTNLSYVNPLPQTVIIGKDYKFVDEEKVLSESTTISETKKDQNEIDILYPKEKAIIPDNFPLIKGVSTPESEVLIIVKTLKKGNEVLSKKVHSDEKGIWKFSSPKEFLSGDYKLTVNTKGQKGENLSLERMFTIAKSGEQVLGQATGSATITSTPSPTQPIISPTAIPTFPPTVTLEPAGFNPGLLALSSMTLLILGLGLLLAF